MFSRGKTYVFPLETKSKILKMIKNDKKIKGKNRIENLNFKIQCFLKEKHMFYHERQNQKYGKILNNDKKD